MSWLPSFGRTADRRPCCIFQDTLSHKTTMKRFHSSGGINTLLLERKHGGSCCLEIANRCKQCLSCHEVLKRFDHLHPFAAWKVFPKQHRGSHRKSMLSLQAVLTSCPCNVKCGSMCLPQTLQPEQVTSVIQLPVSTLESQHVYVGLGWAWKNDQNDLSVQ